ncbi:hypothetical protein [Saccharopolyspora gloriosae]|uniref:Uncharacterized protein n=1 Tax=Saccharopolyspora gloriosae TaxID=455344 RepID=A0A840NHC0_9PSEU|nr:hypothetical protein [Saccharopolyspora gloriosae]MBB5070994.1 hypothetical protein [Saccharopolyspora gloriosae]
MGGAVSPDERQTAPEVLGYNVIVLETPIGLLDEERRSAMSGPDAGVRW